MSDTDRLHEKLKHLRLTGMLHHLDTTLEQATTNNLDVISTLNLLADIEIEQRWQRAILQRWRSSGLKEKLTMDQFDFDHHRSRKDQKNRILQLLHHDFVSAHRGVIFIGHPGTGETFLAKCIAYAACNANIKVLFTTAMDMINRLIAAEADHSLLKQLNHYYTPDLLVCD